MFYYLGEILNTHTAAPKALFLSPNGEVLPDHLICSGLLPAEFGGKPCSYSTGGSFPGIKPLVITAPGYSIDKGKVGDLCPACAISQLAHVGHWQGHGGVNYPDELSPLRLFKCRAGFWLVVPGLCDDTASTINLDAGRTDVAV